MCSQVSVVPRRVKASSSIRNIPLISYIYMRLDLLIIVIQAPHYVEVRPHFPVLNGKERADVKSTVNQLTFVIAC